MSVESSTTVLVVAGTLDEAYSYVRSQHPNLRLLYRRKSVYAGSTRYYLVLRIEDTYGWSRDVPVVLVGTHYRHDWIYRVEDRFTEVTRAPFA
jgi:hypothetical protein